MDKTRLRLQFKKIRENVSKKDRLEVSEKIAKRLFKLKLYKSAKNVALYMNIGSEVGTETIFKKSIALKKTVLAPRVDKKNNTIVFARVKSLKDFKMGAYTILEPKKSCPVWETKEIDLVLVPGILFDKKGHRLGYGKGYYDQFLNFISKEKRIGLTYEKTLVARLPNHKKDVPVSWIITEKRVLQIRHPRPFRHSGESRNPEKFCQLDSGFRRNDDLV